MRLAKFEVRNFKSIEHLQLDWRQLFVVIGENNCGKSSLLSAIACFLSGSAIKNKSLFRCHRTGHADAIELTGYFDQLTDEDSAQLAVRGRIHEGQWILRKTFWLEPTGEDDGASAWKELLQTYSAPETIAGWPQQDNTWAAFPGDFQPLIRQLQGAPARPNVANREALRELVRQHRPDLVEVGQPVWTPNPGGGGPWKSNANSILPRAIFVRAVHEVTDETNAKDASTYGKLINLVVERQLAQRPEMEALTVAIENVLALFRHDPLYPERQAEEIRQLQQKINDGLGQVIGGTVQIRTDVPEIRSLVMPNTALVATDASAGIETEVSDQGHGFQRTLLMTLLQTLADMQQPADARQNQLNTRPSVLLVEEPELYLHPQMERLMRDVLQKIAMLPNMQVGCCTHSPIFLDIADGYRSIVRMFKDEAGQLGSFQVTEDLFSGEDGRSAKDRIQTIARFNSYVNELFFAKSVVLFEEASAIAAIYRAGELTGLFERHPRLRREVALVDCNGKKNIRPFQRVLNAFSMPYRVIHDIDPGQPAEAENRAILGQLSDKATAHGVDPDLEGVLGYVVGGGASKPFEAVKHVEQLHGVGALPDRFMEVLNRVYFGTPAEPALHVDHEEVDAAKAVSAG